MNNLTHDDGDIYTIEALAYNLVNGETTFCTRLMLALIKKHEMTYTESEEFLNDIYYHVGLAMAGTVDTNHHSFS